MIDAPSAGDPAAIERLREVLVRSGYTETGLRALLCAADGIPLGPLDISLYRQRLRGRDALELLASLFALGDAIPAGAARGLLDVDRLAAIGVVREDGDAIRSPLLLRPFADLLFAGERHEARGMRADYVPSLQGATRWAAHLMDPAGGQMLDVGTGCGALALAASGRSAGVTGTDINRRALAFASFNAVLNGVANATWLHGDWFEPVGARRFATVVCNPPYAIGPDRAFAFRDAGPAGEDVTRQAVQSAAAALEVHGRATVTGNWIVADGGAWWERPAAWAQGLGCDVWVLHRRTYDPVAYAATWNRPLREADAAAYEPAVARWVRAHEAAGYHAIAEGVVVLRKRSAGGPGWVRCSAWRSAPGPAAAKQLRRMFAGVDTLKRLGGRSALLSHALRAVDGQRITATSTRRDGAAPARTAYVLVDDGVGIEIEIDPHCLDLLQRCDGSRPLRDVIAAAAAEAGLSEAALAEIAQPAVRALVTTGMLAVVD